LLAQSALDLLLAEDTPRLHACASDTCRWLFLDTSKNRTRRWCDMKTCGNRAKARRYNAAHSA
jgi:predicted RNA-binding Zn ribbon-like protein